MALLPPRKKVFSILRAAWGLRNGVILFCTPLLLLPLPLLVGTSEANCAYVIALMAVYWCAEVLPLAVTAMMPTVLFPLLGVMESKHVCMQYLKDTNMLFVGGLIVAVAVEHWNLHKRIALRVLLVVGVRPALLMLGFMGVTAFLSMWISNTAAAAMMVPIVQAVLSQLNPSQDSQSIPKSQKNGTVPNQGNQRTITVNMQDGGAGQEHPAPRIVEISLNDTGTQQDSQGENTHLQGTVTQQDTIGSEGHPDSWDRVPFQAMPAPQDKPPLDSPNSKRDSGNVVLPMAEPPLEEERKRMCKGLLLSVSYAASIGGIATLTGTGPNLILMGQISQLFPRSGDVVNFASWFAFGFPTMLMMLVLAWLWLQFLFIGFNLRRTWACGAVRSEEEQAAYEVIRREYRLLGPMCYAELNVLVLFLLLVVLWFTRSPGFMDGWATRTFNSKAQFVTDATVAMAAAVLLFVLPSEPPRFWRASDPDVPHSPAPALLTWEVTHKMMPWNIVLLLGGGFAIAKGSEVSGLSLWLGSQMAPLQTIPPWAIIIILCLLIATFTECVSNVATATLFLPIVATLSQSIGVNPLYVMIPCTLCASFAFMLPVATPPNAIVFSYGSLKVSDMAKAGVVMNVIGILCTTLAINSWGRVLFDLDTFPSWANTTATV